MNRDRTDETHARAWSEAIDLMIREFGSTDLRLREGRDVFECLNILRPFKISICLPNGHTEFPIDFSILTSGLLCFYCSSSRISYMAKSICLHYIGRSPIESFFVIDNERSLDAISEDEGHMDFRKSNKQALGESAIEANTTDLISIEKWNYGRMLLCSPKSILASYDQIEKKTADTYNDECIETIKKLFRIRFGARKHVLSVLPI